MQHHTSRQTTVIVATLLTVVTLASGCTVKDDATPPLMGPSGFGTSIDLVATPDTIFQDGASQSRIVVTARGSNGQALRNEVLHAAIAVNGTVVDFGTLSAKTLVTGNDGTATLVYTAPPPVAGETSDPNNVVTILVTPSGTDFANSLARSVLIRLLPTGTILPPNSAPVANFTMSPASAAAGVTIQFDASSSTDDGHIVSYQWTFGDGGTASGVVVSKAYAQPGEYTVTLRVTDNRGLSASISKQVTIAAFGTPVAVFVYSPSSPVAVGQPVIFDATGSQTHPNPLIDRYEWQFTGTPAGAACTPGGAIHTSTGPMTTHHFTAPGNYCVSLRVFTTVGGQATTFRNITVQ